MRVRPFYWILFAACCVGVLVFGAVRQEYVPALLHVRVQQHTTKATIIALSLTDTQGLPVDNANVELHAEMVGMPMPAPLIRVNGQASGLYLVHLDLSMKGSWAISIAVHADGFVIPHQALCIQILPPLPIPS